jgi:c(7)-type cytochrome triheme protein
MASTPLVEFLKKISSTRMLVLAGLVIVIGLTTATVAWAMANPAVIEMKRDSGEDDPPAARFQHWKHQRTYRCYVCHPGIFSTSEKATGITHEEMTKGKYCGVCHNGVIAFYPDQDDSDCEVCHVE